MTIGIYSGSFNPVHKGHVSLCSYLVKQGIVDQVWLIRSPLNPFKVDTASTLAPDDDREAMLKLAVRGRKGLHVSNIEDNLPKPNYSINTFHALERKYPQHQFHLIIGADNWLAFDRWRAYDEFLTRYHLIVYPRPGYEMGEEEQLRLGEEAIRNVRFVDAPLFDISSTEIRTDIASGRKPAMIYPGVFAYIVKNNLYK